MPLSRPMGVVLAGFAALLSSCAQEPGLTTASPEPCILLCALVRSIAGEDDPPKSPPLVSAAVKPPRDTKRHRAGRTSTSHGKAASPSGAPAATAVPGSEPGGSVGDARPLPQALPPERSMQPVSTTPVHSLLPGSAPIDEITSQFVPRGAAQP